MYLKKYCVTVVMMFIILLGGCASRVLPQDSTILKTKVYNPGGESIFPVTSTLISGPSEIILVDAQFQRNDAQKLVEMIKTSGKKLVTVYISHGDPDFYFGLDVIKTAFPEVQILSSPKTLEHIEKTIQRKIDYWGPILKENRPRKLILPTAVSKNKLYVDGQAVEIVGLNGTDPEHTYLWIPSTKTILGGAYLFENMHAWIADTQTSYSRQLWYSSLADIEKRQPNKVIPGHYLGHSQFTLDSVIYTRTYLNAFEKYAAKADDSESLINQLNKRFPDTGGESILNISAKVIMGEMKWPQ